MRSYLEVTWLLNGALCAGVWSLTSVLHEKTISKVRMVTCSVLYSVLCWMMQKTQWTLILKVVLSCMVYGRWLGLIVQSCLMLTVCVHLLGNLNCFVVQNGLLYCEATSGKWLVVIVVCIVLMLMAQRFVVIKKQSELYVPIHLESSQDSFDCIGYLDTGNCAVHEKLPVVFVKIPIECDELISVQSVTGMSCFEAVKATLSMENRTFDVMMAYVPDLQVECLLHVMMK